ncbi:MAG: hypothetical protein JXB49_23340 [Bacteroidales bacterium]|nr:hypothetical protein [Bacteroidales bacterium]
MNSLKILTFSILFISLISCRESALSDVEIDDPSLLKVYGIVWKYCNLDSTDAEVDRIILRLKDKTDHSVDLKKGGVQCNGVEMFSYTDLIGPYYAVPSEVAKVKSDSTYNFIVELADGAEYTGNISIDNKHLKSLSVQSSWKWANDDSLTVSWNDVDEEYTTYILWNITFADGIDHTNESSIGSHNVSDVNTYTFPASFFTNETGEVMIKTLKVHLQSEKEGEIDSRFRSGYVKCRFDYYKDVNIH